MAIYESMVVYGSRLEGPEIEEQITKLRGLIETGDGSIHSIERMGKRRLAYEINKQLDGYYTVFHFQTEPARIAPLQRALRLNESVIRHIVLRKEKFPEGLTVAVEEVATTTGSPEPRGSDETPAASAPGSPKPPAAEAPAEEAPRAAEEESAPESGEAPAAEGVEELAPREAEEGPRAEAEPEDVSEEPEQPEKPREEGE